MHQAIQRQMTDMNLKTTKIMMNQNASSQKSKMSWIKNDWINRNLPKVEFLGLVVAMSAAQCD